MSQYGDIENLVKLSDGVRSVSIKQLLEDEFGYKYDFLKNAGMVVACFCMVFAVTFAFAIKSFNFQKR